jgi:hypothetical protein
VQCGDYLGWLDTNYGTRERLMELA